MTLVQHGIFGYPVDEAVDVSYLADTVVLLRYFEVSGSVRQAISVVKKRSGDHERMIRECKVQNGGLFVGETMYEFQGVLTGVPPYNCAAAPSLRQKDNGSNRTQDATSCDGSRVSNAGETERERRGDGRGPGRDGA